jgi:hypothetical protein
MNCLVCNAFGMETLTNRRKREENKRGKLKGK